ncbi:MAG: glycosyltransferase family 4 protein [Terriglobales bacterium]
MHVLVTADTLGGVWTYTRELVTGLARRGVRVTLVSLGEIPTAEQCAWMEGLRGLDFRPTAFRLEWMQEAEQDLDSSSEFLLSVIRDAAPDLVHFNQFCYGALPLDIPRVVAAHSDVVSWWVSVHGEEPRDTKWLRWYRDVVTRGVAGATAVVAPSRWMLDAVGAYYVRPAQGAVVYNGRNPGLFNPHGTKEDLVLSVGRLWDSAKQVTLLSQCEQKAPVLIAGSDKHPDEVLRGARPAFPARRRMRFTGEQSESRLSHLYSRASMYAATSRYEPFGLAPLEAAFSRCAIIANDIPTFHEIWGDAACYFRYNDAADLAHTIACLQSDRELRLTYANLAYHRARQRYTAERMVDDYMNLYESLVPTGAAVA